MFSYFYIIILLALGQGEIDLSNKKFILNADDFGLSKPFNRAILEGYHNGFLASTSICANGSEFDAAVHEIIPECPNLGIGVHLNIIEGNSLVSGEKFNSGYLKLISLSTNKEFLVKTEKEFRAQIEKILNHTKVSHIDSHVHTHAIPNLFELTCKLAKEYDIKQVRTQFENLYFASDIKKHLNINYPPNLLKIALLNSFTIKNREKIKEYGLITNDYLLGVGYTGMMDENTIYEGLKKIQDERCIVEALIHPCYYGENAAKKTRQIEFMITQNLDLKDKIQRLGFEITNYKK